MAEFEAPPWLSRLRAGDPQAAQALWERYFHRLVQLANGRMGLLPRRVSDEEDVALSALNSFLQGARDGQYPRLEDEENLWSLLVTITLRKMHAHRRRHFAARRGGGGVRGESAFLAGDDPDAPRGLDAVEGAEPTPEVVTQIAEACQHLFDRLNDPLLRDIARWKMEGYSNDEIAQKLGRNTRTVERKIALIRDCWSISA